jgi:lysyl-tRNA synthetase class 2
VENGHDRSDRTGLERLRETRPRLEQRARIGRAIRAWLDDQGFLEVETPLRIESPAPELHIDVEPSGERFLIASPELQMKRLLAAGYERIYQICRCFRRGERGDLHQPEFTMLEWYRRGGGTGDLMRDCEQLIEATAREVSAFPTVERDGRSVDLTGPFERIEVGDAFERAAGWRPGSAPEADRFDRDLVDKVEPWLPFDRPVFLTGYPAAMASLARIDPTDPTRAERFELYAGGLELANGFAELTDPVEQRRRFEAESAARAEAGLATAPLDERFLATLENGLGECAGIALGVDRLVMLLTGAERVDEVVAFPEGTA